MNEPFTEVFSSDVWAFVLSLGGLLALVGIGEGLRATGLLSGEGTRRLVHVGVGLFVVIAPYLFDAPLFVYVLAGLFVLLNGRALLTGKLSSMHGVRRASWGTVVFPLSLLPALALTWSVYAERVYALQIAYLILAIADPAAALGGSRRAERDDTPPATKTLAGSLCFLVTAFLATLFGLKLLPASPWHDAAWMGLAGLALVTALVTAGTEYLGRRGWDNFFIPVAAITVLVALGPFSERWGVGVLAALIGIVFGVLAWRVRALNREGAVAGGLFAFTVLGLGGWVWAVPAFTFFVLSSALSRIGGRRKAEAVGVTEKGSRRDAGQVFANGGVAWGLLVVNIFFPSVWWYVGFLGAFAAAAADTWATEVGTLSAARPRLLTTGRPVSPGTSGGVTLVGTAAALLGAGVVVLSAAPFANLGGVGGVVLLSLSGWLGALVDSFLGATVQVQFVSRRTGQATERPAEAGRPNRLLRGWRWLRNDQVNWIGTAAGAAFAMACFRLLDFAS